MRGLLAVLIAGLCVPSFAQEVIDQSDEALPVAQVEIVISTISAQLVDPDLAKFAGLFLGQNDEWVCGHVNSKNSSGGYAGNTLFYVSIDGANSAMMTETVDSLAMEGFSRQGAADFIEMKAGLFRRVCATDR